MPPPAKILGRGKLPKNQLQGVPENPFMESLIKQLKFLPLKTSPTFWGEQFSRWKDNMSCLLQLVQLGVGLKVERRPGDHLLPIPDEERRGVLGDNNGPRIGMVHTGFLIISPRHSGLMKLPWTMTILP